MNVVGIKELQADIGKLNHCFEHDECTLITRKGKPIGFALSFSDDALVQNGLKSWLAIKAFEKGDLSLGQLAKILGKTKVDTLKMLGQFNIPVADYDLQEDFCYL
jgi:hypothetical protein